MATLINNFNALKAKGMSDSEAMKEAMRLTSESRAKVRAIDEATRKTKAKEKPGWIGKLKMGVTKHLKEKYHSPKGREYLKGK